MRPATHDSDIIKMANDVRVCVRSSRSGFLPEKLLEEVEENAAESLHAFLQASGYRWSNCLEPHNQNTLTETLEQYLEMLHHDQPQTIRYTHVVQRGKPERGRFGESSGTATMQWVIELMLEEASAPCIIKLELQRLPDEPT